MLKKCMMGEYAETVGPVEDKLERRIHYAQHIYTRLEKALEKKRLNIFWIPGQHLLTAYSDYILELALQYCRLIQKLIKDPTCLQMKTADLQTWKAWRDVCSYMFIYFQTY